MTAFGAKRICMDKTTGGAPNRRRRSFVEWFPALALVQTRNERGVQQARCTRRKEKLWLVDSLLPSQPPLSACRLLLLPMPQQLASSKLRKTSSLSLTSDIQTRIRVKLVHVV